MTKLSDTSPMPFGKYKGDDMEDIPASYLMWLWNKNEKKYKAIRGKLGGSDLESVMDYIEDNFDVLQKELST